MTSTPSRFDARTPDDIATLVKAAPLAWIVSTDDEAHAAAPHATLLPLQAQADGQGRVVRLVGHFARHNPHAAALERQPRAQCLFVGPQGYVSPSWMADRTQAPTWNYASVRCAGIVRFHEDAQRLRDEIEALVEAQEAGRASRWRVADMGARYERLAQAIVGFEMDVDAVQGRFKLGQDERDDVFADILRGLALQPGGDAAALAAWMREFNAGRPG